eukprot:258909-Amphidinium_carterae.1
MVLSRGKKRTTEMSTLPARIYSCLRSFHWLCIEVGEGGSIANGYESSLYERQDLSFHHQNFLIVYLNALSGCWRRGRAEIVFFGGQDCCIANRIPPNIARLG